MSVSESLNVPAPTTAKARSRLAPLLPLLIVLAFGLAVLVVMLSIDTGGSAPHHVSGANAQPRLGR